MTKRAVLAYSGGLDTSVAVRWMTEELGTEVVALAADVGQGGDLEAMRQRALAAGAVEAVVADCRGSSPRTTSSPPSRPTPATRASTRSVSSLSRPIIVKHLVAAAREHGADAIAHGCTGKGNDQVRFEVSTARPGARPRGPRPGARVGPHPGARPSSTPSATTSRSRSTKESPYSIDQNLWGRTIECGDARGPLGVAARGGVRARPTPTATEPRDIVVGFEAGRARRRRRRAASPLHELIDEVTAVVGSYGWGRIDMVENRRVGIKSREIYECPGSLALLMAHADLEDLTLERDLAHEKARLEPRYAELVYDGSGSRR